MTNCYHTPIMGPLFSRIILLCLLTFCFVKSGFAYNAIASLATDTTIKTNQELNASYNLIYRENLPAIFFGNEYGGPNKTLLVADINPNLVLLNTKKSRFFFLFSPRVQLRLLSAYHSPVRSPSYMPGGTLFTRLNNDDSHPKFISLGYSHHSNGQEGQTLNSDGSFNTVDGKFTTNFYTLNYYFGKRHLSDTSTRTQSAFIGIELHSGLFGTGFSKQLTDKYGFVRTNGSWFYDWANDKSGMDDHYSNRQRLRFDFTYILDKMYDYQVTDASKRLNVSLKYYYQFGFMENTALTATVGYRGQDPYNIFFQDNYSYFAIGISAGLSFDLHKKHL